MGTPLQEPVINEVPEKGSVGAASLVIVPSAKIIFLILQQVKQFREKKLAHF